MSKLTESAKGVYVIAPTPFDDCGTIDDGSIDTMVEFFLSAGADGLTIMGMMGEAEKLTQDESVAVMTTDGGPGSRPTSAISWLRAGASAACIEPTKAKLEVMAR